MCQSLGLASYQGGCLRWKTATWLWGSRARATETSRHATLGPTATLSPIHRTADPHAECAARKEFATQTGGRCPAAQVSASEIISHLQKNGYDLDSRLDSTARAEAAAFRSLIDAKLAPAVVRCLPAWGGGGRGAGSVALAASAEAILAWVAGHFPLTLGSVFTPIRGAIAAILHVARSGRLQGAHKGPVQSLPPSSSSEPHVV